MMEALNGDSEGKSTQSTWKSERTVWNIGGSQGQHDVEHYHTSPNKAAHLCDCPKHLFMNTCITENKEVKLEILVYSEIYNITEITET